MRITVYIPEDHEKSQEAIKRLATVVTEYAGGLTIYPYCSGVWKDNKGILVHDNISVVETYQEEILTQELKQTFIKELKLELLVIRELLNQDCIAYAIDNNIFFV